MRRRNKVRRVYGDKCVVENGSGGGSQWQRVSGGPFTTRHLLRGQRCRAEPRPAPRVAKPVREREDPNRLPNLHTPENPLALRVLRDRELVPGVRQITRDCSNNKISELLTRVVP